VLYRDDVPVCATAPLQAVIKIVLNNP